MKLLLTMGLAVLLGGQHYNVNAIKLREAQGNSPVVAAQLETEADEFTWDPNHVCLWNVNRIRDQFQSTYSDMVKKYTDLKAAAIAVDPKKPNANNFSDANFP